MRSPKFYFPHIKGVERDVVESLLVLIVIYMSTYFFFSFPFTPLKNYRPFRSTSHILKSFLR